MTMAGYPTKELQDEFINAIRKSQETVVQAVRTWANMAQSVTPKVPSVPMPLADKLPRPEEVVRRRLRLRREAARQPASSWPKSC